MRQRSFYASVGYSMLLALAMGLGCATTGRCAPARDQTERVLVGEFHRTYRLHLPSTYDDATPLPLVLVFHGRFQNARDIEEISHFNAVADREGFIVAYPEGIHGLWNDGRRAPDRLKLMPMLYDDVGFTAALIAHLQATRAIDPARIYAAGMSNGAMLVQRLGCERPDILAAIGPVSGTLPVNVARACTATQPVPVIEFHGTDDAYIRWRGGTVRLLGGRTLSVPDTIAYWQHSNGCTGAATVTELPHQYPSDATRVRREAWDACRNGGAVAFYAIEGGGHMWPGGPDDDTPFTGDKSYDVSAAEVLWAFFAQHPKVTSADRAHLAPSTAMVVPPTQTIVPPPVVPIAPPSATPLPLTVFHFFIKAGFLKPLAPLLASP